MPFRSSVDPDVMAYIDASFTISNTERRLGWVRKSHIELALSELAALLPPERDPYAADNAAFADEVAKLKSMTMAERKAYRWQQRMEDAQNAYRRQRERDAAAGKPPVLKL